MSSPSDHDDLADGVFDEREIGDERAATERGRYLEKTTDLDERTGLAVAWKEIGYVDTPIAREIGVAPTTVSGWLNRARAQYGLDAAAITPIENRGDLTEVTLAYLEELSAPVRAQYREVAVGYPGVVPQDVLNALSGDDDGDDGGEPDDNSGEDEEVFWRE